MLFSNPTPGNTAYLYCNRAEEDRRDPERIPSTLVQQLAQTSGKDGKLLKSVIDVYEERQRGGQKSSRLSFDESQELLTQLTDILHPQTTNRIDALDEVDPKMGLKLLNALKNVVKRWKNVVRFFATTRTDTDIFLQLGSFPRIELQPDDNVSDIDRFVNSSVRSVIADSQLLHGNVSLEVEKEICCVLRSRSKRM